MSKSVDNSTDLKAGISPDESPLQFELRRLEKLTELLRRNGLLAFTSGIASLAVSFACFFRLAPNVAILMMMSYMALTFGVISLTAVITYESYRKRGEALFEEVSDELQWHIRAVSAAAGTVGEKRPDLQARVILRSFARTTDLPLVPGKFGPAVYFAVNVLSSFSVAWILRLYY